MNVFDLLRAGGFALNGDGAGVAETMKFGEDLAEVHQAFADKNLFAKFVGVGGPEAILGMNAAHMGTEDVDRVHRVGLAVEQEVGGVEADAKVGHGHIVDGARHGGGCLLAGFHEEVLAVGLAVFGHGADGFDGLRVERDRRGFQG